MRSRRAGLVLLAGVCMLGACGIDAQDDPEVIDSADVPFHLLDATTSSTRPDRTTMEAGEVPFLVYFVGPDGLAFAIRETQESPSLAERLDALFEGPTVAEFEVGLRTAIPPTARPLRAQVRSGTAQIGLHETFARLRSDEQIDALAQIVYTVTEIETVRRVRFLLDGQPVEVPLADGTLSTDPVTRAAYK